MAILNKNIRQMIFCKIERSMYRVVWIPEETRNRISYADGVFPFRPDNVEAVRISDNDKWYPIIEELPMDKRDILVKSCDYFGTKWRCTRLNSEKDIPVYINLEKEIRELKKRTEMLEERQKTLVDTSVDRNTVPIHYKKND